MGVLASKTEGTSTSGAARATEATVRAANTSTYGTARMSKHPNRQQRRVQSISSVVLASVYAAAIAHQARAVAKDAGASLTKEDKALLETGALVTKATEEQRGELQLFGGQSWQILNVPPKVAWRAITDFAKYKEVIPAATETRPQRAKGNKVDLAIRQQKGPIDVQYVMRMTKKPERGLVLFRLDPTQSGTLRAGWGFVRVRPWKDGSRTLLSFGALVDIGDGMFVAIIKPAVRKHLLRLPERFKAYTEGPGRTQYSTAVEKPNEP